MSDGDIEEAEDGASAGTSPEPVDLIDRTIKRRRRLKWGAFGLWTATVLLFGLAAGAGLYNRWDQDNQAAVNIEVQTQAAPVVDSEGVEVVVPDLFGLTEAESREVLADVGVALDDVDTISVPAVGPPGRVVTQDPPKGTVNPTAVVLGISEEATTPDVVGSDLPDALLALERIGARVLEDERYVPDAEVGTVLSSDPAAGETAPETVTLVVAAAPSAVFVSEVDALESDCGSDDLIVAGTQFPHSTSCRVSPGDEPDINVYQLGGLVDQVTGTVGHADDGAVGVSIRFRLIGDDDEVLFDATVAHGESAPVDVIITDTDRLTLESSVVGDPDIGSTTAVWGDLAFLGSDDAINLLATR